MLKRTDTRARPLRAAILIGGRSLRMGCSKALLAVDGESLLQRTTGVVSPLVDEVYLAGTPPNDVAEAVKRSLQLAELELLEDAPEAQGPIAGILAALRHDPGSDWLMLACDMPLMSEAALRWLIAEHDLGSEGVVGVLTAGDVQPLPGIYSGVGAGRVEAMVASGISSLRALTDGLKVKKVQIPPAMEAAWRNINTIAEWRQLTART